MKKLTLAIVACAFAISLTSCGGGGDAQKWCDCMDAVKGGDLTNSCIADMEEMGKRIEKDEASWKKFKEEANKICPDHAKDLIDPKFD